MRLSVFDFDYPASFIAREPVERGSCRLLIADRRTKEIQHTTFDHIVDFLIPGDCLVLNNTKVFPARLYGKKETGGSVEVILLHELKKGVWRCLGRVSKKFKMGSRLIFGDCFGADVIKIEEDGVVVLAFFGEGDFHALVEKYGQVPLPPYIERAACAEDKERYQTVFAKTEGAAAAPTAGLHWTGALLQKAGEKGIDIAEITLHVGYGTFRPIWTPDVAHHRMHAEYFEIPEASARKINESQRVVAVGTTTVRALESAVSARKVVAGSGWTDLFIYPGFAFQIVDALQTNFHQPRSSLLVMVSAFAETNFIKQCYEEAIRKLYRLFSYGDTMLIL